MHLTHCPPEMGAPSTFIPSCSRGVCPPVYSAYLGRQPHGTAQLGLRWQNRHSGLLSGYRNSSGQCHIIRSTCGRKGGASAAAGLTALADCRPVGCSSNAQPAASDAQGAHRLRNVCIGLGLTLAFSCLAAGLPRSALASVALSTTSITREGKASYSHSALCAVPLTCCTQLLVLSRLHLPGS